MGRFLIAGLLSMVCVCNFGCAFIKPTTQIWVDPSGRFNVYNTKDVRVEFGGIEAEKMADGSMVFRLIPSTQPGFVITDASSPVIRENIGQMLAFVEQQKAANEGIDIVMKGLPGIIAEMVPIFQAFNVPKPVQQSFIEKLTGLSGTLQQAKTAVNAIQCPQGNCGQ